MENVNLNEACLLPPHVGGRLMLVSRYQVTIYKWRLRCVKNYNLQVVDQMCEKNNWHQRMILSPESKSVCIRDCPSLSIRVKLLSLYNWQRTADEYLRNGLEPLPLSP